MTPDASPTSPSPGSRRRTGLVKCQGSRAVSARADAVVSDRVDSWYKRSNEHNQRNSSAAEDSHVRVLHLYYIPHRTMQLTLYEELVMAASLKSRCLQSWV